MAQWKRAGPITQRSEDQNLALLTNYFLFVCFFVFVFLLFYEIYFPFLVTAASKTFKFNKGPANKNCHFIFYTSKNENLIKN